MIIPNTITILWNGTNATIPAGFTRNTDFDGKYLYGVDTGVDPDGTGGNSTHTHTSPAHNHTQDSHTHSVSGGASSEATATRIGTKKYSTATHTQNAKDSSTATPTNQTATVTVNTASNELTRRDIIFIKSNGTNAVPNDASVFYDDTPPTNWTKILDDKFLKGAGTGLDSSNQAGSLNTHTHTTASHNHTQNAHSHATFTSGTASGSTIGAGTGRYSNAKFHTHQVSLDSNTAVNSATTATLSGTEDGTPPYYKLLVIQNDTGGESYFDGMIGLYTGLRANIPKDWTEITGMRTKFLMVTETEGEIGDTGGLDLHDHTAVTHTHTQIAHYHTVTAQQASFSDTALFGFGRGLSDGNHIGHTWSCSSVAGTNQNTLITINNCSSKANYPEYGEVMYVKWNRFNQVINML